MQVSSQRQQFQTVVQFLLCQTFLPFYAENYLAEYLIVYLSSFFICSQNLLLCCLPLCTLCVPIYTMCVTERMCLRSTQ